MRLPNLKRPGFFDSMDYIILALATYRLSSLLANEDGPLGLFERFRRFAGVMVDEHGSRYGDNNFASGLVCVWCNSVWVGVVLTGAYAIEPGVLWLCYPLALSAGAIIINRWVNGF